MGSKNKMKHVSFTQKKKLFCFNKNFLLFGSTTIVEF